QETKTQFVEKIKEVAKEKIIEEPIPTPIGENFSVSPETHLLDYSYSQILDNHQNKQSI
ncbi:39440_t:CDS:2, partial [Gigaspora margarita]